jgi:hypothetical protein
MSIVRAGGINYICDGVDDHVQIQEAIDRVSPGKVSLSAGKFFLGEPLRLQSGTVLEGEGWGTALDPATDAGVTVLCPAPGVTAITATDQDAFIVANLKVYGGLAGISIITTLGSGMRRHFVLENLAFNGQAGSALQIVGAGPSDLLVGWRANNILVRRVGVAGIFVRHASDFAGSQWYTCGTAGHGIVIRDSAAFAVDYIRGDWAGPEAAGGNFHGLTFVNINNASFSHVAAHYNKGTGIVVNSGGSDIVFTGGWAWGNGRDDALPPYERAGMSVSESSAFVTIQGMSFHNRGTYTQQYGMVDIGPTLTLIGNSFHANMLGSVRNIHPSAIVLGNRGINTKELRGEL